MLRGRRPGGLRDGAGVAVPRRVGDGRAGLFIERVRGDETRWCRGVRELRQEENARYESEQEGLGNARRQGESSKDLVAWLDCALACEPDRAQTDGKLLPASSTARAGWRIDSCGAILRLKSLRHMRRPGRALLIADVSSIRHDQSGLTAIPRFKPTSAAECVAEPKRAAPPERACKRLANFISACIRCRCALRASLAVDVRGGIPGGIARAPDAIVGGEHVGIRHATTWIRRRRRNPCRRAAFRCCPTRRAA